MAWGLGALAGPWLTGLLMDRAGPALLPATIAAIYGLLTLAALARAPVRSLPKMSRPEYRLPWPRWQPSLHRAAEHAQA
jgi:hypothetical protein